MKDEMTKTNSKKSTVDLENSRVHREEIEWKSP